MTQTRLPAPDEERILQRLTSLRLAGALLAPAPDEAEAAPLPQTPGADRLWQHATRAPGAPVDLAVHRALRTDAAARNRYARMIDAMAQGCSPLARAASTGDAIRRLIGPYSLSLVPGSTGDADFLVLSASDEAAFEPKRLEALSAPGAEPAYASIDLPATVRGTIMLALERGRDDHAALLALLAAPASTLWLM